MAYESGAYLRAKWTPDTGGGGAQNIKVLNNKAVEKVTELVKKLAGNSALPERYAGFGDFECSFSALVDSANLPTKSTALNFRAGAKGTMQFPVGTSAGAENNWFYAHVIVLEVSYGNPVDDLLQYDVKVALDASANAATQSSPFVYPT